MEGFVFKNRLGGWEARVDGTAIAVRAEGRQLAVTLAVSRAAELTITQAAEFSSS